MNDPDELYAATEVIPDIVKAMSKSIVAKRNNKITKRNNKTAQQIHDHLLAINKKYKSIVNGTGDYPSQSETELAFCNLVALETQDPQVINQVYYLTNLPRDKWKEKRPGGTYGSITIDKALSASCPKNETAFNEKVKLENCIEAGTG